MKIAEVHLLHSNDWMNAHHFVDGLKVQRFCLTLLGEARLWFQSLESYKCRLARIAKFIKTEIFKGRYTCENKCFMHGDLLVLMKIQRP